jgi:hypothetical protein
VGWPGCRGCIAETELPGFALTNGSFGFLFWEIIKIFHRRARRERRGKQEIPNLNIQDPNKSQIPIPKHLSLEFCHIGLMIIWDLVLAFWNFLVSASSALSAVNLFFGGEIF